MNEPKDPRHFETQAVRHQAERSPYQEHSVPIYMTSSFVFETAEEGRALFAGELDGPIYSRYTNPNVDEFVQKIVQMEGAEDGVATASGMAAIFGAIAGLTQSGDHILACRSVFGSTYQILTQILPRWGIRTTFFDILKPETWESLVEPTTKIVFIETPSNPGLDLIDLEFIGDLCKRRNLILIVDNCFATPYLQKPIEWGAHVSLHSATKFLDGQGRGLGGLIVGNADVIEPIRFFTRQTGPSLSAFNAWMFSKSLETLAVRMDRHCDNSIYIAKRLEGHPLIQQLKHPGLPSHPQYALAQKQMRRGGALFSLELKGGLSAGQKFLDRLKILSLTANLGDSRTTATHPASTTHSKLTEEERLAVGITPGLVRISIGLEHPQDILTDILQAIEGASALS